MKTLSIRLLATALFLTIGSPCHASDWVYVDVGIIETGTKTVYYIDAQSIKKNKTLTTFWMKRVRMTHPIATFKEMVGISCQDNTVGPMASDDPQFSVLNGSITPPIMFQIPPDSPYEDWYKAVCIPGKIANLKKESEVSEYNAYMSIFESEKPKREINDTKELLNLKPE